MIPAINNLRDLLSQVNYRKWAFDCGVLGEGYFLRVRFEEGGEQLGRKWYVSRNSLPGEVLQTALLAVLTALEHEVREHFLFTGRPIFHPHHPLPVLYESALQREHRPEQAGSPLNSEISNPFSPEPMQDGRDAAIARRVLNACVARVQEEIDEDVTDDPCRLIMLDMLVTSFGAIDLKAVVANAVTEAAS